MESEKIVALKGCKRGYHGPWLIVRTMEGKLRHTCEQCGYYEENCRPGEGVYPKEMAHEPKILGHERRAIELITAEVYRQTVKWGQPDHPFFKWIAIAGEEFGEICQEALHENHEALEKEVIQLAAVMAQWVTCLQRNKPTIVSIRDTPISTSVLTHLDGMISEQKGAKNA